MFAAGGITRAGADGTLRAHDGCPRRAASVGVAGGLLKLATPGGLRKRRDRPVGSGGARRAGRSGEGRVAEGRSVRFRGHKNSEAGSGSETGLGLFWAR